MKRFFACLLFAWLNTTYAQTACPVPKQKAVIFFGNGIATSKEAAQRSLDRLHQEIGDSYNSQSLRYDLSYNQTDGIALDLAQSVMQAGAQWDSQIMGWLNALGVVPDWFANWYEHYALAATMTYVPELDEHAGKYRTAILFGQKVVVVSHSQGNFYVNEVKKLLTAQLTPEEMKSFSIFGVAVPANNVGGANGPYYTNHRDIILNVPTSMPYNWALHHANGAIADDVPRLDAHYFNQTYMSDDFDIKPALVIGIKGLLAAAPAPTPVCTDTYQRHMVSLFAGDYDCFAGVTPSKIGNASIGADASIKVLGQTFDGAAPDVGLSMNRQIVNATGDPLAMSFTATKYTGLNSTTALSSGTWSTAGQFQSLMIGGDQPAIGCFAKSGSGEFIKKPVNFGVEAASLMAGHHGTFPAKRCLTITNGAMSINSKPVAYYASENILTIGNADYDLDGARLDEQFIVSDMYSNSLYSQFGDTFTFKTTYANGDFLTLDFERYRGARSFTYTTASSSLTCTQPK